MLDICLLGTGGLRPLPNRFLTSLYMKFEGHAMLIDCGEGTQVALGSAGCKPASIDLICITHFHADHIAGLPGLLLTMGIMERTRPVTIAGPKGLYQILESMLVITGGGIPFEIYVHEFEDKKPKPLTLGSASVRPFPLEHRIPCCGYNIEISRSGKFLPDKAESLGVPRELWGKLQKGETVKVGFKKIKPSQVLSAPRRGLKAVYATDTLPLRSIAREGKDADLMILEGLYGDVSLAEKANDRGHMTFSQAAELARDAGAEELWLTHFSPALTDPEGFIHIAQEIFPEAAAGFDGKKKTLKFRE